MSNPLLTIVVPTLGRDLEFKRFLASLKNQNIGDLEIFSKIELIVSDQNHDDTVAKHLFDSLPFKLTRLSLKQKGTSNAKNAALFEAQGKFICFLDDDCWLEPSALLRLLPVLNAASGKNGFLISARTPDDKPFVPSQFGIKFKLNAQNITKAFYAPQIGQVFSLQSCKGLGGFNMRLGVGTYFGSAEETDLLVRSIKSGVEFSYLSDVIAYHPDVDYDTMSPQKSFSYGLGFGAFCKIHGWTLYWIYKMLRSATAGVIYVLAEPKKAAAYWATLKGRWAGYWLYPVAEKESNR